MTKQVNLTVGIFAHLLTVLAICAAIRFDLAWISYVALVPWAMTLDWISLRGTFIAATVGGTCIGLVGFDFVLSTSLGLRPWLWIPGSLLITGLNWGTCSWIAHQSRIRGVPLLLVMIGSWFLFDVNLRYTTRLLIDDGIPLLQLGTIPSQSGLGQLAAVGGLSLVGIAVVTINGIVAQWVTGLWKRETTRVCFAGIAGIAFAAGTFLLVPPPRADANSMETIRVGISGQVIESTPLRSRLIGSEDDVDLLVFGEHSFLADGLIAMPRRSPGSDDSATGPARTLWELAQHSAIPFMVTAPRYWPADGILAYHSAILVTSESGVDQAYDKRYLVCEMERRPRLLRMVDSIRSKINLGPAMAVGQQATPFVLEKLGIRIGPTICYDLFFEKPFTEYANMDVDLLVNCASHRLLDSRMNELALRHARLRAIESGRPIVHVAIDGTSAVFDGWGREVHRSSTPQTMIGCHRVDIPLQTRHTSISRFGCGTMDVFLGAGFVAGISLSLCKRRIQPIS